jgi:PAS domain S-box-containing protein
MKISTRLNISSIMSICLFTIMVGLLVWCSGQLQRAGANDILADDIQTSIFRRVTLRDEYFFYQVERAEQQLLAASRRTRQLLKTGAGQFTDPDERRVLEEMQADFDQTAQIFQRLAQQAKRLEGGERSLHDDEFGKRLYGQIMLRSAALQEASGQLQKLTRTRFNRAINLAISSAGLCVFLMAAALILNASLVNRLLRRKLRALRTGAAIIAAGDLDCRIDCEGSDELAELGGVLNGMTERVQDYTNALQYNKKRIRLQLRELNNIYTHTPVGIFAVDRDLRFLRLNECMARINGRPIEEHLGRTVDEALPADLAANLKELWRPVLERGESLMNIELQGNVWCAPEVPRHWLAGYHPLFSDAGEVIGLMGSVQDITDRKLAEHALQKSEERYRSVVEDQTEVIVRCRPDGTYTFVNEAYCRLLGKPAHQLIGSRWHPETLLEDVATIEEQLALLSPTNPVVTIESRVHSDSLHWIQFVNRGFFDDQGALVEIQAVGRDITLRKDLEHKLRESEMQYRTLVMNAPFQVSNVDCDGVIYFVNRCPEGLDAASVVGSSSYDYLEEESRDIYRQALGKVFSSHLPQNIVVRGFGDHGQVRYYEAVLGPLVSEGKVSSAIQVTLDVTKRKLAEKQLQESNMRFSTVFYASPIAIGISRMDNGRYIDVNDTFLELFGYTRAEVLGHTSQELELGAIAGEREAMLEELREGGVRQFEAAFRHKSGRVGHLLLSAEFIELAGQRLLMVMLSDISIRKEAEMILSGINEELELQVAERTASQSLANERLIQEIEERKRIEQEILDHQEKLQSMALELALAEERERDRIAGELHDQVGQRLILAKMKLDSLTSRLSSAKLECDAEEVLGLIDQTIQDIRSLTFQIRPPLLASAGLEAAVQWLGEEMRADYGLSMEFEDDRQPKPLIYEIRSTVFQSVREILLNVAKHARTDRVRVRMARDADALLVEISDEGIGFDTLGRAALNSRTGGFGLQNVRQRVSYLGGRLEISSEIGKGTRATISIPLDNSPEEPREAIDA